VKPFPVEYARALPKAELHVHLEGTVAALTLLDLAERHGVEPPALDLEGVDEWYQFDDFDQFIERYFRIIGLLREPDDFAMVAERYLLEAHDQGVVHVEFHVSATGHLVESGHRWGPIQEGIVDGCERAAATTGMSYCLIPDISPHLEADDTFSAVQEVLADPHPAVRALGMGGPARPHWWEKDFQPAFDAAREQGLAVVAHAAEHGDADEIRFAVERFGAQRIQHGIGAMTDPEVVRMLIDNGIVCDVCPGSNLALGAVPDAASHPLPAMIDAGITVSLGSDDPPLFQTTLLDEYERAWDWCGLDEDGLVRLAKASLEASLAPADDIAHWVSELG